MLPPFWVRWKMPEARKPPLLALLEQEEVWPAAAKIRVPVMSRAARR